MEKRLRRIFQQSFGINDIDDSISVDNIKGWDSMAHVGLMMALQKEFNVTISPAQAIELTNVGSIKTFLKKRGVD